MREINTYAISNRRFVLTKSGRTKYQNYLDRWCDGSWQSTNTSMLRILSILLSRRTRPRTLSWVNRWMAHKKQKHPWWLMIALSKIFWRKYIKRRWKKTLRDSLKQRRSRWQMRWSCLAIKRWYEQDPWRHRHRRRLFSNRKIQKITDQFQTFLIMLQLPRDRRIRDPNRGSLLERPVDCRRKESRYHLLCARDFQFLIKN